MWRIEGGVWGRTNVEKRKREKKKWQPHNQRERTEITNILKKEKNKKSKKFFKNSEGAHKKTKNITD